MIQGKFYLGSEGLDKSAALRYEVFTAELGMPISMEKDVYDQFGHHLIVEDGGGLVGTGRLIYKADQFLIGRIAIDTKARGQKNR